MIIKRNPLKEIFSGLIDIIYPTRCHACDRFLDETERGQVNICQDCLESFRRIIPPFCSVCGRPFISKVGGNHLCENCIRNSPHYDILASPYLYEGVLMDVIHQFKYSGKRHYARSLGLLLSSYTTCWLNNPSDYLMMPVPLHPKKLRERGFNQSLLLARAMNTVLGIELDFLSLRRIKYSVPQTGLSMKERKKNVRKAFELSDSIDTKGRTIILVDDVATTGSTLNECARVLKRSGFEKILCLVLARTSGYGQ